MVKVGKTHYLVLLIASAVGPFVWGIVLIKISWCPCTLMSLLPSSQYNWPPLHVHRIPVVGLIHGNNILWVRSGIWKEISCSQKPYYTVDHFISNTTKLQPKQGAFNFIYLQAGTSKRRRMLITGSWCEQSLASLPGDQSSRRVQSISDILKLRWLPHMALGSW